jgi:putative transposase
MQIFCEVLYVSRSGYYALMQRKSVCLEPNKELLMGIIHNHTKTQATFGSLRVKEELCSRGLSVGHNRVVRLMIEGF